MSNPNPLTGPIPTTEEFPAVPPVNGPMAIPSSPLLSQDRGVRAAWQAALYTIRKRNKAARNNGGVRPPLA